MKTETEDHKQTQKNVAENSKYEELHTDFKGEQNQEDVVKDHSNAEGTVAAPQTNSDEEVYVIVWETAL